MALNTAVVLDENAEIRKRRKKLIFSIIVGVVLLHVLGGIGAAFLIVAKYLMPPPATFEVKKDIRLAAQEREHRMNMAEFDAMTPKPSFSDKMASERPMDFALPDIPPIPVDQMLPLDPSAIVSDQITGLLGTAGLGAGGDGSGGMGGTGQGVSFLGVRSSGRRILLMYDISMTVKNAAARAGMPMERIREETERLIQGLGINTRFGMVQFARNYAFFQNELLPSTDPNKERAIEWLRDWFAVEGSMPRNAPNLVTGSPGFVRLLEAAFRMQPDLIYVISDGDFYQGGERGSKIPYEEIEKKIEELQKTLPEPVKINFIGVEMKPENMKQMRRIIRGPGNGQFKELRK